MIRYFIGDLVIILLFSIGLAFFLEHLESLGMPGWIGSAAQLALPALLGFKLGANSGRRLP